MFRKGITQEVEEQQADKRGWRVTMDGSPVRFEESKNIMFFNLEISNLKWAVCFV